MIKLFTFGCALTYAACVYAGSRGFRRDVSRWEIQNRVTRRLEHKYVEIYNDRNPVPDLNDSQLNAPKSGIWQLIARGKPHSVTNRDKKYLENWDTSHVTKTVYDQVQKDMQSWEFTKTVCFDSL